MASVFLSHNSRDKGFAERIAWDLKSHGVHVWVDEAEVKVGDSLIQKIESAISAVDYLGVLLSRSSVESEWVRREVEIALNQEIHNKRVFVLPMLIDNCEIPAFLKGRLYADFRERKSYDNALRKILQRLGALHPPPPRRREKDGEKPFTIAVNVYDGESDEIYKRLGTISSPEEGLYVNMVYFIDDDVCVDLLIPGVVYSVYKNDIFEAYRIETDTYSQTLAWLEVYFSRAAKSPHEVEEICLDIIRKHNDQLRWLLYFSKPPGDEFSS